MTSYMVFLGISILAFNFSSAITFDNLDVLPNVTNNDAELGSHFEGDMVLNEEQSAIMLNGMHTMQNMPSKVIKKWPNNEVIYKFSNFHNYSEKKQIRTAMDVIESISCVKFIEQSNQNVYVQITAFDTGCHSSVGYSGTTESQKFNLQRYPIGAGCFRLGTIIHELLHTLGFLHMHSAPQRDDYVKIVYENIAKINHPNFERYNASESERMAYFAEYDYLSILHYDRLAFSQNNWNTILTLDPFYYDKIGQRKRMTDLDVKNLNEYYNCN